MANLYALFEPWLVGAIGTLCALWLLRRCGVGRLADRAGAPSATDCATPCGSTCGACGASQRSANAGR